MLNCLTAKLKDLRRNLRIIRNLSIGHGIWLIYDPEKQSIRFWPKSILSRRKIYGP